MNTNNHNDKYKHFLNTALQHHFAGRFNDAQSFCSKILEQNPSHPDALHLLGVIELQTNHYSTAIHYLNKAITIKPHFPDALSNLGTAYAKTGLWEPATRCYKQSLKINGNNPTTLNCYGNALVNLGQFNRAKTAFHQAIQLKPDYPDAIYNLANLLKTLGNFGEAIIFYTQALHYQPQHIDALNNLGNTLRCIGRIDEAITCFQRTLHFKPDSSIAINNLGNALRQKGELDSACECFHRLIRSQPDNYEAYNNLGSIYKDMGKLDEACKNYLRALTIQPTRADIHSNLLFTLHYLPKYTSQDLYRQNLAWSKRHERPRNKYISLDCHDRSPNRCLRIGYISPNFMNHCQSLFTIPLFSSHNHHNFQIFCYSDTHFPDALTNRIQGFADKWQNIFSMTDHDVVQLIRNDKIDILVDLTMHMEHNRLTLFAYKPAPIQITWLAYPGTTGLQTIDYRLTDPYLDPPDAEQNFYSEKSIRLAHSFWCYNPLNQELVPNALPAVSNKYITFGCFNNFCKINDNVLYLWAKILTQLPNSKVMILSPKGSCRQRIQSLFHHNNISEDRIIFRNNGDRTYYLNLYKEIDIGPDTFPYNGHTTSLDSFWMGVPVVTLIGETIVGRAGFCQLSNLGLTELAAHSQQEYIELAIALGSNLSNLQSLRKELRQRMEKSPLMDAPSFTQNVELIYRQIWQDWCRRKSWKHP